MEVEIDAPDGLSSVADEWVRVRVTLEGVTDYCFADTAQTTCAVLSHGIHVLCIEGRVGVDFGGSRVLTSAYRRDYGRVIMNRKARTVGAAEFEANCLALLEEVAATGVPLVVTKGERAVARVEPTVSDRTVDLRGSVVREGDLLSPIGDESSA